MFRRPKVLLLTVNDEQAGNVQDALENHVLLTRIATIAEMKSSLGEADYDAVFCAWAFYQSDWDGPLREVRECYPDLPMIILSCSGEEQEWTEIIEAGAFDLLVLPTPSPLALAVIEQAVASYEARKAQRIAAAGSTCKE